ncbi:MAG: hypothetical protein ACRDP1_16860 [Nocardioidaceae bacterium]
MASDLPGSSGAASTGTVCASAATVTPMPAAVASIPLPSGVVPYAVEDRGSAGTVITAVSAASMNVVLGQLNKAYRSGGFSITSGETDDHDAEADWKHGGQVGRWAIRDLASQCGGSGTSVQVLVSP